MVNLKSKIYVAGHNGLVGSAIVKKLKEKGYKKIQALSEIKNILQKEGKIMTIFLIIIFRIHIY